MQDGAAAFDAAAFDVAAADKAARSPAAAVRAVATQPVNLTPTHALGRPHWPVAEAEGGRRGEEARERDHALLACGLRLAMPASDTIDALAERALIRFGSFAAVLAAPLAELRGVSGFGPHSLSMLKLMREAALRLARAQVAAEPILSDRAGLLGYLTAILAREQIEQFRILFLDARDHLLADEAQARGTVNHTPVYPREVVRRALELEASAIVLVHNHPSGDPTPSREDLAMTRQIAQVCSLMGVQLRDHLVVGNGRWTSFAEAGLLV